MHETYVAGARRAPSDFQPMSVAATQHLIERTYRESGRFQWVRETVKNALEAGAARIEYGIEWQAVENKGVYRRTIIDNAKGMTALELKAFFNTFGGGGKPIGGVHENFGVGSKTSLLPWNRFGVVVVSKKRGEMAMIRVQQNSETGEYGLRVEEVYDDLENRRLEAVYQPFQDDELGCDWGQVFPEWVDDHGTAVILLGNGLEDDTVNGDPNRDEADITGISSYLNRRLWGIPEGVQITVDEVRHNDRRQWPLNREMAVDVTSKRRTNRRRIEGARYFIEYPRSTYEGGKITASGTVFLLDGTAVDWFLWDGIRPAVQSYAAVSGYVAALYRDELYDVSSNNFAYRAFGISESMVRQNLWLIVRPVELHDESGVGVYPRTDRNSLLLRGGPDAGKPLPYSDWGAEFADAMPPELLAAIVRARGSDAQEFTDEQWRERLAGRFGSRWRIPRLRARESGADTVDPSQAGTQSRRRIVAAVSGGSSGTSGGRGGDVLIGSRPGTISAARTTVAGGVPSFRPAPAADVGEHWLASWRPTYPGHPEGVVLINFQHPVLRAQVEYYQVQFAEHHADAVREEVIKAYGEIAAAKIAHSEHLRGLVPSDMIDDTMRSDEALTMALLGLMAEDAVISPRVGGRFGRRRQAA